MSADAPSSTLAGDEHGLVEPRRQRPGAGAVLGALAAVTASIGLASWLGADDSRLQSTGAAGSPPASASRPLASPTVDDGQVRRAYEQFQVLYAEGGMDRLMQSARSCAQTLRDDPRILDFCLALDMYASTLPPQGAEQHAWFTSAPARRLELARDAMADAEAAPVRIAAIERLTRIAAPNPGAPGRTHAPSSSRTQRLTAPTPSLAAATPAPVPTRKAVYKPPTPEARRASPQGDRTASPGCRDTRSASGRLVCATPALRQADREMLRAYDRALAAGMDEHRLNRDQARWRRALEVAGGDRRQVARLYERRTWELNADARARE